MCKGIEVQRRRNLLHIEVRERRERKKMDKIEEGIFDGRWKQAVCKTEVQEIREGMVYMRILVAWVLARKIMWTERQSHVPRITTEVVCYVPHMFCGDYDGIVSYGILSFN